MSFIRLLGSKPLFSTIGLVLFCIVAGVISITEAAKTMRPKGDVQEEAFISWRKYRKIGHLVTGVCFILFSFAVVFFAGSEWGDIPCYIFGIGVFGGMGIRAVNNYKTFRSMSAKGHVSE